MSSFTPGATVEVHAKGKVGQDGTLVIGCKSFTKKDVADYALSYTETVPEPEWEYGDYVTDANGVSYVRKGSLGTRPEGYWQIAYNHTGGFAASDDNPVKPLTLVARGGKPVTDDTPPMIGERVRIKPGARFFAKFSQRSTPVNGGIYDLIPAYSVIQKTGYDISPNVCVGGYLVLPEFVQRAT